MNIELNPELNLKELSSQFAVARRLRVENFFTSQAAEYILAQLKETSWHLVHSDENGLPIRYGAEKYAALSSNQRHQILAELNQRATNSYQYIYKFFPIIDAIKAGALPDSSMLFQMANFLNGTEFMQFSRTLTGANTLVKVDPQATLYEAGHFLSTHDDSNYQRSAQDNSIRRFAIVLGFTKDWSKDWGGHTSFYPSLDACHSNSWHPGFNVLSIFEVPTLHSVAYVAPFAGGGRYSITGWLRDDSTIKRPDLGDV